MVVVSPCSTTSASCASWFRREESQGLTGPEETAEVGALSGAISSSKLPTVLGGESGLPFQRRPNRERAKGVLAGAWRARTAAAEEPGYPPPRGRGGCEERRRGALPNAVSGGRPSPREEGRAGSGALSPSPAFGELGSQLGGSRARKGKAGAAGWRRPASSEGRGRLRPASELCRPAPRWLGTQLLVLGPFLPRRAPGS